MVGVSGLWCAGTESVWFGTRCLLAAGPLCYGCAAVCLPANWLSNSSPALRHLPPHSPVRGLGDVTKLVITIIKLCGCDEGKWPMSFSCVFVTVQAMGILSNKESSLVIELSSLIIRNASMVSNKINIYPIAVLTEFDVIMKVLASLATIYLVKYPGIGIGIVG